MGRAAWLLGLLLCASCVSTSSNVCADGSYCPRGFTCDLDNDRCLLPEQIAECTVGGTKMPDGTECTYSGIPGACLDGACEAFFCGDTRVTAGEDCDPGRNASDESGHVLGPMNDLDCASLGYYGTDGLRCTRTCTFDRSVCEERYGRCQNGVVEGPELCDGPQMRTCVALGFDAGTASCNAVCSFSITDCSRFGWNPESLSDVIALAIAGTRRDEQWAFGMHGRALRFDGAAWSAVPTGVHNDFVGAWANAPDDTWAVGQSSEALPSVVVHWDGTAWSTVTGIPAGEYVDVWGTAGPRAVYVASSSGAAIHRYDGATWTTLPEFDGEPIALRGSSASDIWVATRGGPLMHWNGTAWTNRSPAGTSIRFLDVNAANDVWAIGHASNDPGTGVIAHYDGATWTQWVTAQEIYNAIASAAPNDAWVAGVDGILRHWDGVAWSRTTNVGASPSGLTALSGLLSIGPSDVIGVSTLGIAYRYRGQAFGLFSGLGTNPFDAPQNLAIWGPAANAMYVTNVAGEVHRFDGTSWSVVHSVGSGVAARTIWGTTTSNIFVGAHDGRVHHFNGTTWTSQAVANAMPIWQVWGTTASSVWAFTSGVAFQRLGTVWTPRVFGSRRPLSVSGTSDSDIWLVEAGTTGTTSRLLHYNGTAWSEVVTGASYPVLAVAALAPDNVHVTAGEGRLLHFDGTAWTETAVPVLAPLTYITATAYDDVIAASERDLAHFNGIAWSTMRTPVDFLPNTSDYIPIAGLQASPGRIDMLTQRYRIRTLIRTRPLICRAAEICGDGVDNDCDDLLDSLDTECM
jgi:hypothetical protein